MPQVEYEEQINEIKDRWRKASFIKSVREGENFDQILSDMIQMSDILHTKINNEKQIQEKAAEKLSVFFELGQAYQQKSHAILEAAWGTVPFANFVSLTERIKF